MDQTEWMEELLEWAKEDPEYQACLETVRDLEPEFLALRDALTEDRRNVLDAYLSACEEMDHALLSLAEHLTRQQCQREFASILRLDALYSDSYRNMRTPGTKAPERTPEYPDRCRAFNETARRVMADTDVEIPLIGPEEK